MSSSSFGVEQVGFADGAALRSGSDAPSDAVGTDGDYWLQSGGDETVALYKRVAGIYEPVTSGGSGGALLPGESGTQIVGDDGGIAYEFPDNVPVFAFRADGKAFDQFVVWASGSIYSGSGNVPYKLLIQRSGLTSIVVGESGDAVFFGQGGTSVGQDGSINLQTVGSLVHFAPGSVDVGTNAVNICGGCTVDPGAWAFAPDDVLIDLRDGSVWTCLSESGGMATSWANSKWLQSPDLTWWKPTIDNAGVVTYVSA